jgi:hypothetical protein
VKAKATRSRAADFFEDKVPADKSVTEEGSLSTKPVKTPKISSARKENGKEAAVPNLKENSVSKTEKKDKPAERAKKSANGKAGTKSESTAIVASNGKEKKQSKGGVKSGQEAKEEEDVFGGLSSDEDGPLNEVETAALLAGFDSSDDSSEEEGLALDKIPTAPKPSKAVQKELAMARKEGDNSDNAPGVLYIG